MSKLMYSYEELQEVVTDFNEEQARQFTSRGLSIVFYRTDGRIAKHSVTMHLYMSGMKVRQSKVINYDQAVDYVQLITLLLSVH